MLAVHGTGFCESSFSQPCSEPACPLGAGKSSTGITHEALGVKRLLDDLELKPDRIPDSELGWSKAKKLAVEARAVRKLVGYVILRAVVRGRIRNIANRSR